MRFSVPRSLSPSPTRQNSRKSFTFGVPSDSEDESESDQAESSLESESSTPSVSSSDSSDESESDTPPPSRNIPSTSRNPDVKRRIQDTVAAIRLRTRHRDPYEEWERETRKEAFRTARKEQTVLRSKLNNERERIQKIENERLAALHARQMAEVAAQLEALTVQRQQEEKRLVDGWNARDKRLWERIEGVIKFEENKLKASLEAERKVKEEEEVKKRKKEEELKRRLEEEKKKNEEETQRKELEAKRKEEERQKLKEKEELDRQSKKEEQRLAKERSQAEEESSNAFGASKATADWKLARQNLLQLKAGPMRTVKSSKQLKSTWSALRRQITPKIGQLTNDAQAIARISQQLHEILIPPSSPPHPQEVYYALLSSLAKSILLQAETEVTAEKRSARPLALVTVNLLSSLEGFGEIFYAKLVQRAGGWPLPVVLPTTDADGTPWKDEAARVKALGYRKGANDDIETAAEYSTRVAGMMRVYFHILKTRVSQPLHPMFHLPRYWTWFARLLSNAVLLETAVAPQLLYTALDVFGLEAKDVWGHQWIKILALMYDGVTAGIGGGRTVGGQSAEGKAARVRVQLEIERIMNVMSG